MIFPKISKGRMQWIASLRQKKKRTEEGVFVAEGSKCVLDTLKHFELVAVVATEEWLFQHSTIIEQICDQIIAASRSEMERMTSLSTAPDVIAVYKTPAFSIEEWSRGIDSRLSLVLDGIQDPGNLGTIIRTADWFGVHHIIASPDTVDAFNTKTVQATMGAISRLNIVYTDLYAFLDSFPQLTKYGTLLNGENIYKSHLKQTGLIIFGNEGKGISQKIREKIDRPLLIPSFPENAATSESLNVGVATAITLAEFRRRTFN